MNVIFACADLAGLVLLSVMRRVGLCVESQHSYTENVKISEVNLSAFVNRLLHSCAAFILIYISFTSEYVTEPIWLTVFISEFITTSVLWQ